MYVSSIPPPLCLISTSAFVIHSVPSRLSTSVLPLSCLLSVMANDINPPALGQKSQFSNAEDAERERGGDGVVRKRVVAFARERSEAEILIERERAGEGGN